MYGNAFRQQTTILYFCNTFQTSFNHRLFLFRILQGLQNYFQTFFCEDNVKPEIIVLIEPNKVEHKIIVDHKYVFAKRTRNLPKYFFSRNISYIVKLCMRIFN